MIEKIIKRQNDNGGQFWSREDGNIHAPSGSSTIDTLSVLGEIGYSFNDNPLIADAIALIRTKLQMVVLSIHRIAQSYLV